MTRQTPLLQTAHSWYGCMLAKRTIVAVAAVLFAVAVLVGSNVVSLSVAVISAVLVATPFAYGLFRAKLSTIGFYSDRLVVVPDPFSPLSSRTTIPYEAIAFIIAPGPVLPHRSFYVVHSAGCLPVRCVAAGDEAADLLEEYVPDVENRVTDMDRHTARWLVLQNLDDEEDDVLVSKSRVVRALDCDPTRDYRLVPTRFGSIDEVETVDDVEISDICVDTGRTSAPG